MRLESPFQPPPPVMSVEKASAGTQYPHLPPTPHTTKLLIAMRAGPIDHASVDKSN